MPVVAGSLLKNNIELEHELGSGAMGVVWRARNLALDSPVAVKVLAARVAADPEARARFAQEARAVARIDSAHVVRIFDYGVTEEGEPFFVMELLRGDDLRARIQAGGTLDLATTLTIVRQLCAALGRAHELGIVHRDVKPANVFLLHESGGPFVKVLDFGIAKLASAQDLELTASNALVGTPYYMSPEQFVDPRRIDHRADLWSVAVIAYACLVGKLPFVGETVGGLSLAVHRGVFPAPSEARPTLPAPLDAWFRRALDPEPGGRFESADALAQSFADAARGSASKDAPSPPPDRGSNAETRAQGAAPLIDESMGGVGAPVGAPRSPRPVAARLLVAVAVLVTGALFLLRVLPRASVATEPDASAAPVSSPVASAAAASAEPRSEPDATPAAAGSTPPSASAPLPPPPPRRRPSPPPAVSADAPPLAAPRLDVDGVPIVR
jgi:eukaryotic-like serine/threonine-protein kinase